MSYKIKLLPIAYKDLQQAKRWYNKKRKNLGEEFKRAVITEIDYIKDHPEHFQRKHKELRQSLVTRFPYAIFYLIEESNKQIIIFGVLHASRNPEIASNRIK